MKLFKYLKKEYATNIIAKGEVYIGTLSYYRDIEDESRADRLEGKKTVVTKITETKTITNNEEMEKELPHFKGSNISYERGTVIVEPGEHKANDDIFDSYIYCVSQNNDERLMTKFEADCCVEIFDVNKFILLVHDELVRLGLIYYKVPSSGRAIEYIGHEVSFDMDISGNWLKRDAYKDEAEFRFCFIPVMKKNGNIIHPTVNEDNSVSFPRDTDEVIIEQLTIKINPKELAKCCRLI